MKKDRPFICWKRSRSRGLMVSGGIYWQCGKLQPGRVPQRAAGAAGPRLQNKGRASAPRALCAEPAPPGPRNRRRNPPMWPHCVRAIAPVRLEWAGGFGMLAVVNFKIHPWYEYKPEVLFPLWMITCALGENISDGFLKTNYFSMKSGA